MMVDCIPFVNSNDDCRILGKYYADARACRLLLSSAVKLRPQIPSGLPLWIDPGVDAYDHIWATSWPVDIQSQSANDVAKTWPCDNKGKKEKEWKFRLLERWHDQFSRFRGHRLLLQKDCWKKAHEHELYGFVSDVLSECLTLRPAWVTIPQLPVGKESARVNKALAQTVGSWITERSECCRLVLPVIITGTSVLRSKPMRDKTLQLALNCYAESNANAIWVVDTTLKDQDRNERFSERYEILIDFHQALRKSLPRAAIVIAGPYWGINLVLWARGLCDYPAVSMGTSYTYSIPYGQPNQGIPRLALPPLRRWVIASQELPVWLNTVLQSLSTSDAAFEQFSEIRKNFSALSHKAAAADQVARFYVEWLKKIQSIQPEGRALRLYQDLSSAFVLGRQMPPLPKTTLPDAPAKVLKAWTVAEQLMLHCL
jgi:hypothetical protein